MDNFAGEGKYAIALSSVIVVGLIIVLWHFFQQGFDDFRSALCEEHQLSTVLIDVNGFGAHSLHI